MEKLEVIDQRFEEIEEEKKKILDSLAVSNVPQPCSKSPVVKTQETHSSSDTFKIKY